MTSNGAAGPPRHLRTPEAARFLGLSDRTLEKHRSYGTGPVYRKIGGKWFIVQEHVSVPVDLETMKPDLMSKP